MFMLKNYLKINTHTLLIPLSLSKQQQNELQIHFIFIYF